MDKPVMITKMVQEEMGKLLNESYIMSDDRFKFKQRVTNSFFYNYSTFTTEFDTDIKESDMVVSWTISFWLNQMGIENFIIDVEKIEGTFTMEMYDLHTDELKQQTPKNIQDFEWKYVIDDDKAMLMMGKSLYIHELDFDFKTKTCTVTF
jgi:hypothetical protein